METACVTMIFKKIGYEREEKCKVVVGSPTNIVAFKTPVF